MSHITEHRIRRSSIQREAEVWTTLAILCTYQNIKVMLLLQIKLIAQSVGCTPSPACAHIICSLILCAVVIGIGSVGIKYREECTPGRCSLIIVQLSTVNQIFDWLDFQVTSSMQVMINTLVVTRLLIQHLIDRVNRIRVVFIHPAFQIFGCGIIAIGIIHRDSRVSTEHIGKLIAILVTNLDTLILLVLIVDILTNLHNIHALVIAIDDML